MDTLTKMLTAITKDEEAQKKVFETTDYHKQFEMIAKELIENYVLVKQIGNVETRYDFAKIEFYLHRSNIQDKSVHEHSYNAGQFRVHYSGIDITFDSDKETNYGGILIRGLRRHKVENDQKPLINGPWCSLVELMDGMTIYESEKKKLSLFMIKDSALSKRLQLSSEVNKRMNIGKNGENFKHLPALFQSKEIKP